MQEYRLKLVPASCPDFDWEDELVVERIYDCGCSNVAFGVLDGQFCLDVTCKAADVTEAVMSTVRQLNRADIYIDRVAIPQDDLSAEVN